MRPFSILALILLAPLLAAPALGAPDDDPRPIVQASEILSKIERGEPVDYDGVIIEGDLDLSGLDLPKRRIERTEFELKNLGLSEDAKLVESSISIKGSEIRDCVNLGNAIFQESVNFKNTNLTEAARFSGARFSGDDVSFWGANFNGDNVSFGGTEFSGDDVSFVGAHFSGDYAYFGGAEFRGSNVSFVGAHFSGDANFWGAEFSGGDTSFEGAEFNGGDAYFGEAEFSGGDAFFRKAKFSGGDAFFRKAKFNGSDAYFDEAHFSGNANFWGAEFNGEEANFGWAKFSGGDADFGWAEFNGDANFWGTEFNGGDVDFGWAKFSGGANFEGAKFSSGDVNFGWAKFSGGANFVEAEFSGLDADFGWAEFSGGDASFEKVHFIGRYAGFVGAQFSGGEANFRDAEFGEAATFEDIHFNHTNFMLDDTKNIRILWLSNTTFENESSISLNGTGYERLYVHWDQIQDALIYNGEVYLTIVKNFRNIEYFEDADCCYYQYRRDRQSMREWSEVPKYTDILGWVTCGYGVRPGYTLAWSAWFIIFFGVTFWTGNGIHKIETPNQKNPHESTKKRWCVSSVCCLPFNKLSNMVWRILDDSKILVETLLKIRPSTLCHLPRRIWNASFVTDLSLKDALYFSTMVFVSQPPHDWRPKERWKYWVMLEDVLGWLLLALFLVTLGNVMIR